MTFPREDFRPTPSPEVEFDVEAFVRQSDLPPSIPGVDGALFDPMISRSAEDGAAIE